MQRQRDRETIASQPRLRRAWGELLAAWLLVLSGIAWIGLMFPMMRMGMKYHPLFFVSLLYMIPGFVVLLCGGAVLARARKLAKWLLISLSVPLVALGVWFSYYALQLERDFLLGNLISVAVCLIGAAILTVLGRWLGSREDVTE